MKNSKLVDADFYKANIKNIVFDGAIFENTNFFGTNILDEYPSIDGSEIIFSPKGDPINYSHYGFTVNELGSTIDFSQDDLTGLIISGETFRNLSINEKNFSGSVFKNIIFEDMNITNSKFYGVQFHNVTFKNSNIMNSDFSGSKMEKFDFLEGNLKNSEFKHTNGAISFNDSFLHNIDFSYSSISGSLFKNADLRTSNFDHSSLDQSKFINSNLNGLSISHSQLRSASFENSDVENLKIDNSLLHHLTFDKNSKMSDDLRYQIYLTNSLEPIENFVDYLDRVFKNQLTKRFGFVDNPFTKFY